MAASFMHARRRAGSHEERFSKRIRATQSNAIGEHCPTFRTSHDLDLAFAAPAIQFAIAVRKLNSS
jgi:hypothetical protein